jgi:ankyrin repeat protein
MQPETWWKNQAGRTGYTAVDFAAARGNEEVVRLLLRFRGSGPGVRRKEDGRVVHRPVAWAARNGLVGMVRVLLERGFDMMPRGRRIRVLLGRRF